VNKIAPKGGDASDKTSPTAKPDAAAPKDSSKSAAAGSQKPTAKVTVQNIEVLTTNESEAAVTGIAAGVTLATSGFDRLENGAPVTVKQTGQKGAKGAAPSATAATTTSGQSAP